MEGVVQEIREELKILKTRVEELTDRVNELEGKVPSTPKIVQNEDTLSTHIIDEPGKGLGEWVTRGALLQRIAAVSFVMVFALLLRAVTDSGSINVRVGSLLGICYVSVLVGIGWYFYSKGKMLAPVFASFGFLLLFSIVVESRIRFETLSASLSLFFLYSALAVSSIIGLKFKAHRLLIIGVVGAVLTSLIIDFPKTDFAGAGPLLILANIVAFRADRKEVSIGLKWYITILTVLFWFLWAFKLNMPLKNGGQLASNLHAEWYIPELLVFGVIYLVVPLKRYFSEESPGLFYSILSSLNMLLIFLAGRVMVIGHWESSLAMGMLSISLVSILFFFGWRLSSQGEDRSIGIGASFVAGAVILALGLPELTGNVSYAVPFWSVTAYGLAVLSGRGRSGAVRVISYLYQIFTLFAGFMAGIYVVNEESFKLAPFFAALVLSAISILQFRWCRMNPPPKETLFGRADNRDYSAVCLLLVALVGLFFFFSMSIDLVAGSMFAEPFNVSWCGRSVLINFAAIFLMIMGYQRRSLEFIWVAVGLGVFAMLKVFFADLFKTSGIPLVFSVLSFGILATAGSVVLGKWQRKVQI